MKFAYLRFAHRFSCLGMSSPQPPAQRGPRVVPGAECSDLEGKSSVVQTSIISSYRVSYVVALGKYHGKKQQIKHIKHTQQRAHDSLRLFET